MLIEPPVILDESVKVVEWAMKMTDSYHSVSLIFSILLDEKINKNWKKDEEAMEAREIFRRFSPSRDSVLLAIQLNAYRLKNDIKEGQIVTDGETVGFAYDVDYEKRTFDLHSNKEESETTYLATYDMDDFKKV